MISIEIVNAILDTRFDSYLTQEFIPILVDDAGKAASLQNAINICDI